MSSDITTASNDDGWDHSWLRDADEAELRIIITGFDDDGSSQLHAALDELLRRERRDALTEAAAALLDWSGIGWDAANKVGDWLRERAEGQR